MTLRDYQQDCLDAILDRYRAGARRQIVCLPTGTGKTVIFASFPGFFGMKNRMLVLAHREELLDQAREKILSANPQLNVAIEQAARTADDEADVVVASVATLGRKGSKRLARLDPEQFYLIVVDEAHHAIAETYRRVLDHFGALDPDTRKLTVGFTATPKRGDNQGLNKVFEEIVFSRNLPEMIEAKYLSPIAAYRVETEVDLSRVRTRMGDFVTGQLSQAVNVGERNGIVIDVFRKHLEERQTLVFCVDVAHAEDLAKAFCEAGISAAAVTGKMPTDERRAALDGFGSGKIQVLTNCMVLTEGYDESSIEGIILARPTKSTLLYTQMIGRGTRLHPGKENVTIIDIVDVTRDHKLVGLPSLFGLGKDFDLEGHTTTQVREAVEWVRKNRPWVRADMATSLSDLRYRCKRIDLFDLETPEEIVYDAEFAWTAAADGGYRLSLGHGETLTIESTIMGQWETALEPNVEGMRFQPVRDPCHAVVNAEEWVRRHRADSLTLVRADARWRCAPASERQLAFLNRRGITPPNGTSKGQASRLIAMLS